MLLTFEVGRLLGLEDCNKLSSVEADMLRLLTPLAKLYTAKQVSVKCQFCVCVCFKVSCCTSGLSLMIAELALSQ